MSTKNIKSISKLEDEIETCQKEIKKNQKIINSNYEELTKIYFNLRNILEDERNHEDKLICRPLKREKEKEYKKRQELDKIRQKEKIEKFHDEQIEKGKIAIDKKMADQEKRLRDELDKNAQIYS